MALPNHLWFQNLVNSPFLLKYSDLDCSLLTIPIVLKNFPHSGFEKINLSNQKFLLGTSSLFVLPVIIKKAD